MPAAVRRTSVALLAALGASLALAACGGSSGSDSTGQITDTLTTGLKTNDPAVLCTKTFSTGFVQRIYGSQAKCIAVETKNAKTNKPATAVKVTNVKVDGGTATAVVAVTGGDNDGAGGQLSLVSQQKGWRVDDLSSALLRSQFDAGVRNDRQVAADLKACIAKKVSALDDASFRTLSYGSMGDQPAASAQIKSIVTDCLTQTSGTTSATGAGTGTASVLRKKFEQGISESLKKDNIASRRDHMRRAQAAQRHQRQADRRPHRVRHHVRTAEARPGHRSRDGRLQRDEVGPARRMARPTFDLQSHSTCSDGSLAPAEVVARAHAAGVELLALSDHDTVDGVGEALEAAAGLEGIAVVTAVEISALDGGHDDLHILGYAIDHTSPALLEALAAWRVDRHARALRMAEALRGEGLELDLPQTSPAARPIGRPHIAQAVLDHPANAARLRSEGLGDPGAVLEAYLLPGRPGYRRRTTPTVDEAVAAIHAAGGLAVWAHPYWDVDADEDVRATLTRFAAGGIDGVEAFYVTHTCEQTTRLVELARELGLLTTGSADFHGPLHARFNAFRAFDLCGHEPDLGPLATT